MLSRGLLRLAGATRGAACQGPAQQAPAGLPAIACPLKGAEELPAAQ